MRGRYLSEIAASRQRGRTVRDVMTHALLTATPDDRLDVVAGRLRREGIGALAVVRDGRLTGIVTERDVVRAVAEGRDPRRTRAADCMTPDPMTIRASDTLQDAMSLMRVLGVRHLPVVDDGRPSGIVSLRDVLRVA